MAETKKQVREKGIESVLTSRQTSSHSTTMGLRNAPPSGARLLPTSHDQLCDDVNGQSRRTPVYLQGNENVNAVVCPESYRQAGHTLPAAKCNSEHRRSI